MALLRRRKFAGFGAIQINGGSAFRARTLEALQLLSSHSCFEVVQAHVALIKQGTRSGMKAWFKEPTFVVGKRTWKHSALWYAGAIAHDAYHAKLYADAKKVSRGKEPDANAWTGTEAEKKCLAFQRQVLVELKADLKTISYIDECLKSPTYQGHSTGWQAWLDYVKRWW